MSPIVEGVSMNCEQEMWSQDEVSIDLKALLAVALKKWRVYLAGALIGAVLLGAYCVHKGNVTQYTQVDSDALTEYQDYEKALATYTEVQALLETISGNGPEEVRANYESMVSLYNAQKSLYEYNMGVNTGRLAATREYIEKSLKMKIDAYHEARAVAYFSVKSEGSVQVGVRGVLEADGEKEALLGCYSSLLDVDGVWNSLAKEFDTEEAYLREVVNFGYDYGLDRLVLQVIFEEEDGAQNILESLTDRILSYQGKAEDLLGEHELIFLGQDISYVVDDDLSTWQKMINNDVLNCQQQAVSIQTSLNALQAPVSEEELDKLGGIENLTLPENPVKPAGYDDYVKTGKVEKTVTERQPAGMKSILKYVLIGILLGIFLPAFCVVVIPVLKGRVLTAEDVTEAYKIRSLSVVGKEIPKKFGSGLDEAFERFRLGGKQYRLSTEESMEIAALNIRQSAGEAKKLLFTGSVNAEKLEKVQAGLAERLKEYTLETAVHIVANAVELEKVMNCDGVILVEEAEVSAHKDIRKELLAIRDSGKTVLGTIVI